MHTYSFLCLVVLAILLPFGSPAVVVVTVTATASKASPTPNDPPSYTDAGQFQKAILDTHNTYRSQHNATALSWNQSLTSYATRWANACVFKHSGGPSGENLAAGYANASATVSAWGDERSSYSFAKQGFYEKTGHFTQVVWKSTKTVGCGRARCFGKNNTPGWYVVCEYYPAGNLIGYFEQNVQAPIKSFASHIQTSGSGGRVAHPGVRHTSTMIASALMALLL